MDFNIPDLPDLKSFKLPNVAIGRRKALIAGGVAVAVIAVVFVGGLLLHDYMESRQVAAFGGHVAASEADLSRVYERTSVYLHSSPDSPSIAEADAYAREFAAVADYGMAVTAYHRQVIGADAVPETYAGAQAAYLRALDNLNRAFSLWSSAAVAYDIQAYSSATRNLAAADQAWKDYVAAIEDYSRELRVAEEGEGLPST
ncbi:MULTISPECIES: hypothetical protein [unclassified Methanoculleus]|jgi:tetratricopeptide (TPR) repeat protein|uniref:Uncharacterized protein n=1 Tax=Methanoculleus palmolei TaxID=72612 RepID=A0ABD8AA48_9EURY|nr:hypothetical protein [Methanoculleus sp. UBA377]MDD2473739.1 hypothetical protein [Methanoculleus sp.]WOX56401.1 hypothetical protein R6Y95_03470 [Methanoculleus palmolei]